VLQRLQIPLVAQTALVDALREWKAVCGSSPGYRIIRFSELPGLSDEMRKHFRDLDNHGRWVGPPDPPGEPASGLLPDLVDERNMPMLQPILEACIMPMYASLALVAAGRAYQASNPTFRQFGEQPDGSFVLFSHLPALSEEMRQHFRDFERAGRWEGPPQPRSESEIAHEEYLAMRAAGTWPWPDPDDKRDLPILDPAKPEPKKVEAIVDPLGGYKPDADKKRSPSGNPRKLVLGIPEDRWTRVWRFP
jgi:hypothetical protein